MIALTPCETIVSTCDACRWASLSALAKSILAFAAAIASVDRLLLRDAERLDLVERNADRDVLRARGIERRRGRQQRRRQPRIPNRPSHSLLPFAVPCIVRAAEKPCLSAPPFAAPGCACDPARNSGITGERRLRICAEARHRAETATSRISAAHHVVGIRVGTDQRSGRCRSSSAAGSEHAAEHAAAAAEQAGAAENDGGDDGELEAVAEVRVDHADAADEDQPGNRAAQAGRP